MTPISPTNWDPFAFLDDDDSTWLHVRDRE